MGDGALAVLRLCKMVNLGWRVAMRSDPFWYLHVRGQGLMHGGLGYHNMYVYGEMTYPMAKVLQSAAGASDVIAIWSIVLAEMCSEVVGSKRITFPCVLPSSRSQYTFNRFRGSCCDNIPKATFPFLIHAAQVIFS